MLICSGNYQYVIRFRNCVNALQMAYESTLVFICLFVCLFVLVENKSWRWWFPSNREEDGVQYAAILYIPSSSNGTRYSLRVNERPNDGWMLALWQYETGSTGSQRTAKWLSIGSIFDILKFHGTWNDNNNNTTLTAAILVLLCINKHDDSVYKFYLGTQS